MRIKKLEIHGFKSFAEKAVLQFGHGITGVVGPNGCGKSNIVDALRWCMGEMSAKHLRGRAMQDVIFAGSDSRGPLGLAEVTITFDNDGNVSPQYAGFSEIAVTRRLHRDGTSEYLVNKVPARLRDITDLFLGTGVGTRAYSIIEQGRIGFIVSSKPEDRRTLIEEVAGITKFKARKKAAERRMESTQQNLQRVGDVVSELERQLGSLRRQAQKAERYKRLRGELRDLELHASTLEYLRLEALDKVQRAEAERLQTALVDAQIAVASRESSLEVERLRLMDIERTLQSEQQVSADIDSKLAALERDLTHWQKQRHDAEQRVVAVRHDVEEAEAKLSQARSERDGLSGELDTLGSRVDADRERTETIEMQVEELRAQLASLDHEAEALRRSAVEHIHNAAQQRSLVSAIEKRRLELRTRLEAATAELSTVSQRRDEARARHTQLQARKDEAATQMQEWRERASAYRLELEQCTRAAHESERAVQELKDKAGERRSRLASLVEIAERFEGYSDGVRSLMGGEDGARPVAGLKALVTEILEVEAQYERAIEAVLGERLQYVVVEAHGDARQAIEYLRQNEGGRGGFVPMRPRLAARSTGALPQGALARALDVVTVRPEFRGAAEALLGDVVITADLEAALAAWSQATADSRGVYVTQSGEVLDSTGVIAGGSAEGAGLLAKRREIRELEVVVAQLDAELTAARERHDEIERRLLQTEVDIQQLDKDLHAAQLEQVEVVKDLEAAALDLKRSGERAEVLGYEVEQQREELSRLDEDERAAKDAAQLAEQKQHEVEAGLAGIKDRREVLAEELSARSEELTRSKIEIATRAEKLASAKATVDRLSHAERELAARIQRDHAVIAHSQKEAAELAERIERGAELAATTSVEAQQRREHLAETRARYEEDRAALAGLEAGVREHRKAGSDAQDALGKILMELQRMEHERVRLLEQVFERHDVKLLDVLTDYHLRPLPGAEATERRLELDRSIKQMGPINLTAIDECNEIEGRYQFLVKQRDDLAEALESLKRAIQRINRASRERFQEAFDAVNEMFMQVYPRLFRGGEARLELVSSEDLLEAGVEIIAQPPGKKLQSVQLLSGGEKALTATALVFAIFLIKPSPFCVLDEVDAPLDEANVGRFNEMLREISKISQFIVITHNKNTMSKADKLYGVTMQEPGMSTIVSVNLEDRREHAA